MAYLSISKSFSPSIFYSTLAYTETEFVFYEYKVVAFSSYISILSDFFILVTQAQSMGEGGLSKGALIGVVCGAVAAAFIMLTIVALVVRKANMKEVLSSEYSSSKSAAKGETCFQEKIDEELENFMYQEKDQWL